MSEMDSLDQRRSYRVEISDRKAVLRKGFRDLIVQLEDVSSGGFAVSYHQRIKIAEGQNCFLRTANGWFEVELVHETPEGDTWEYGFRLIRELDDPRNRGILSGTGAPAPTARQGGLWLACTAAFVLAAIVAAHALFPERLTWWQPLARWLIGN